MKIPKLPRSRSPNTQNNSSSKNLRTTPKSTGANKSARPKRKRRKTDFRLTEDEDQSRYNLEFDPERGYEFDQETKDFQKGKERLDSLLLAHGFDYQTWSAFCNKTLPLLSDLAVNRNDGQVSDLQWMCENLLYFWIADIDPAELEKLDPLIVASLYNECEKFIVSSGFLTLDRASRNATLSFKKRQSIVERSVRLAQYHSLLTQVGLGIYELITEYGFDMPLGWKILDELNYLRKANSTPRLRYKSGLEVVFCGRTPIYKKIPRSGPFDVFMHNCLYIYTIGTRRSQEEAFDFLTPVMALLDEPLHLDTFLQTRQKRLRERDPDVAKRFRQTYQAVVKKIYSDKNLPSLPKFMAALWSNRKLRVHNDP